MLNLSVNVTWVCVDAIPVGLLTINLKETKVFVDAVSTVSGVIVNETTVGFVETLANAGCIKLKIKRTTRIALMVFFIFSPNSKLVKLIISVH